MPPWADGAMFLCPHCEQVWEPFDRRRDENGDEDWDWDYLDEETQAGIWARVVRWFHTVIGSE